MFENFKIISFPYVVWSHSAVASLCTVLRKCFGAITVTPKPFEKLVLRTQKRAQEKTRCVVIAASHPEARLSPFEVELAWQP